LPFLDAASGQECGAGFGLCYSPEFIALGSVLHDFLNPDLVLIGESDERAGEQLAGIYRRVLDKDAPIQRMAIANAELAKISLNTFVTTRITFANMLAEMCERLPEGDVDAVTTALGLDSRVGPRYFEAGLGFGGPCFPRDNDALRFWSSAVGVPAPIAGSTNELNHELGRGVVAKVAERCGPESTVAVLGLSYKPGSPVLEGSVPLELATALAGRGFQVVAFDPLSDAFEAGAIDDRIRLVRSLQEAVGAADVVVIANADPAFAALGPDDLPGRPLVVFDCWRLLRVRLEGAPNVEYVALGLGPSARASRTADALRAGAAS
jgi:UDPglucose 6-dehydrogenase